MRAMCVTTHLISSNNNFSLNNEITPPRKTLNKEMAVYQFACPFCVQDMVHVAVKFKTRLLKPLILLPMGNYISTRAHLHILTHI